jgi:hypothetical protein
MEERRHVTASRGRQGMNDDGGGGALADFIESHARAVGLVNVCAANF